MKLQTLYEELQTELRNQDTRISFLKRDWEQFEKTKEEIDKALENYDARMQRLEDIMAKIESSLARRGFI